MIDAWPSTSGGGSFWSQRSNVPFLVVRRNGPALTGAGAYSVDAKGVRPGALATAVITVGLFVVAIAAAVTTWILLNGTNRCTSQPERLELRQVRIATVVTIVTQSPLIVMVTVQYMWIDDTSADVIKVDFRSPLPRDFLVEGDCSEQFRPRRCV